MSIMSSATRVESIAGTHNVVYFEFIPTWMCWHVSGVEEDWRNTCATQLGRVLHGGPARFISGNGTITRMESSSGNSWRSHGGLCGATTRVMELSKEQRSVNYQHDAWDCTRSHHYIAS